MLTSKFLIINTRDELLRIDCSKIVYIESDGNLTKVIMKNKLQLMVSMNLANIQKVITTTLREQAPMFARIGKRHIINTTYITQLNILRQTLLLSDGENFAFQLKPSKEALKQLKTMLMKPITNANQNKQ